VSSRLSRFALFAAAGLVVWLAAHTALRAYGLFGPADARRLIVLSFLMLWPTPFLLLTREERRAVGFGAPRKAMWWLIAFLAGAAFAGAAFALCFALYGASAENPFVSVRASFLTGAGIPDVGPLALFLIFTGPALVFSPIGEEFFCRGVIQERVGSVWGAAAGVVASAGVFAALHMLHHGITFRDGAIGFIGVSGLVWFALMFGVSMLFTTLRKGGGSIWLAVVAHAGFNVVMNAAIFSAFD
jgi:uncharacterized protein